MTRDDIIRMAREAWNQAGENWVVPHWFDGRAEAFVHFAALVAAAERERCAQVCEDMGRGHGSAFAEFDCAAAIRARGNT